ncbi:Uncharacterised protein [Shigella sonnei]|nr:Uncharacterised protein [Shigella sonnei]CSE37674.1 Uncharacterised protein [Shigella sonnei]CSE48777.1 Uncharacterised protein [Shigella sonnei]CSE52839.1 Uncharacterised protein [Shigella sonnei]CSE81315.1 Uncharacterised protein [Shigella sonnei]
MQQPLTRQHIRERCPALECPKHGTFGGVVHRVLFNFRTMCRMPGIILRQIAIKDVGENALIRWKQPAFQRPGVGMRSKTFGGRSGRTAADTVRVDDAHIRVKPLLSITFKCPQTIEKRLRIRHFFTLAGLHLRLRPVDGVNLGT